MLIEVVSDFLLLLLVLIQQRINFLLKNRQIFDNDSPDYSVVNFVIAVNHPVAH